MENIAISPTLSSRGITVSAAIISAKIANRRSGSLERFISSQIKELDIAFLLHSDILRAYKIFYQNLDVVPPAEHLLRIIERSGRLPNINNVIDCANIMSASSLLSFGAHDIEKIKGNIRFDITQGNEQYIPLGKTEKEQIHVGEYACMDDEKILCRMDIKNCDETKVAKETKQFILYAQGNEKTPEAYVQKNLIAACDYIQQFCEGKYTIIQTIYS